MGRGGREERESVLDENEGGEQEMGASEIEGRRKVARGWWVVKSEIEGRKEKDAQLTSDV